MKILNSHWRALRYALLLGFVPFSEPLHVGLERSATMRAMWLALTAPGLRLPILLTMASLSGRCLVIACAIFAQHGELSSAAEGLVSVLFPLPVPFPLSGTFF
jgi:hypothetical protein